MCLIFFLMMVNMQDEKKTKRKMFVYKFEKFNLEVLLYQKYIHQDRDQHDVSW